MNDFCEILKFRINMLYKLKQNYCDSFEKTNEDENEMIYSLLHKISSSDNNKEYKLLFRGENKGRLKSKLFIQNSDYKEEKLFERLFYFEDKAKSYFKNNSKLLGYLNSINDISKETFQYIFDQLSEIFRKHSNTATIADFKLKNKDFFNFFVNINNKSKFINKMINMKDDLRLQLRDYYLYLIHTGKFFESKKRTYFVSTSEKNNIASHFANDDKNNKSGVILLYFIKKPFSDAGINLEIIKELEPTINRFEIPLFSSDLYPNEYEFAIKGGLFPHQIIAVYDTSDSKMVVNPHIFLYDQSIDSILCNGGIKIDQSEFPYKMRDTGYKGYVSYFEDKKVYSDKDV